MAIIPGNEKVFMVDKRTNTVYGGSAALQAMQQWYTMQDVRESANTVPAEELPLNEVVEINSVGDYQKTYAIRWTPSSNARVPFFIFQANDQPESGVGSMGLIEVNWTTEAPGQTYSDTFLVSLLWENAVGIWDQYYSTGIATTTDYGVNPVTQLGIRNEYIVLYPDEVLSATITITGEKYSFAGIGSFAD